MSIEPTMNTFKNICINKESSNCESQKNNTNMVKKDIYEKEFSCYMQEASDIYTCQGTYANSICESVAENSILYKNEESNTDEGFFLVTSRDGTYMSCCSCGEDGKVLWELKTTKEQADAVQDYLSNCEDEDITYYKNIAFWQELFESLADANP